MTVSLSTAGLWVLRLIAAVIMLQTLFFKFTGSEESVYIFSQLGMEPWGRIGTGILELLASLLILFPKTSFLGAALGAGLMAGAIGAHLVKLGIEVKGDGGLLFIYAILVFAASVILMFVYREDLLAFLRKVLHKIS